MTPRTHPSGQRPASGPPPLHLPAAPPSAGYAGVLAPYGPPSRPGRRRWGTRTVVGAVAGGGVAVAGLGIGALALVGTPALDVAAVETRIARLTEEQAALAPAGVTCPADVAAGSGTTFSCTATLDGQPVSYTVRQTDDDGTVSIASDDTFVLLGAVEDALAAQLGAEAGVPVVTACRAGEHRVLVDGVGLPIACSVARAADPTDSVDGVATVDEAGAVSWSAP